MNRSESIQILAISSTIEDQHLLVRWQMDLSAGSPVGRDMDDHTTDDEALTGGTEGRSNPDSCEVPEDTSPEDDQRKSHNSAAPALALVASRASTTSQRDDEEESASACSVDNGGRSIAMVHAWHPEGGNGRDPPEQRRACVETEAASTGAGEHDEGSRVEQLHVPEIHKPIQYRCLPAAAPPVGQIPHYAYQRQMSSSSVVQGPGPSRGFRGYHPIEQFQQRQAPPPHYVYPPYVHVAPTVPTVHTQKPPQPQVLTLRQRSASDKGCSCSKTQCLKLYCSCFTNNLLCNKEVCICSDCKNCEAESAEGTFCS